MGNEIKVEMELEPFRTPNYVMVKAKIGRRQDGFQERPKYHITELSVETLEKLCEQFRWDILAKKTGALDSSGE